MKEQSDSHVIASGPIDIARLAQELAAVAGTALIFTTGAAAGAEGATSYTATGATADQVRDALAKSKPADRSRSVLLAAAETIEEVAAGKRAWVDVPDADRVLAAALLVCIDMLESPPIVRQIDAGRPSYTAAERRVRRQPKAGRSAVVPPGG